MTNNYNNIIMYLLNDFAVRLHCIVLDLEGLVNLLNPRVLLKALPRAIAVVAGLFILPAPPVQADLYKILD